MASYPDAAAIAERYFDSRAVMSPSGVEINGEINDG